MQKMHLLFVYRVFMCLFKIPYSKWEMNMVFSIKSKS